MELTYYAKAPPIKTPRGGRSFSVSKADAPVPLGQLMLDPFTTSVEIVQEYMIRNKAHKVTEVVVEPLPTDASLLNIKSVFKLYKKRQSKLGEHRRASIRKTSPGTVATKTNIASTYKFTVKCAESWDRQHDRKYENRSYKFHADSDDDRQRWIAAIEIVMSRKKQALERQKHSHLFIGSRDYESFIQYLLLKAPPLRLLQCFNAIRQQVEEQEVTALMVLYDHGTQNHSNLIPSIPLCQAAVLDEIANSSDYGTLFRRNSVSTKLIALFFKIHGLSYLQDLLQTKLIKICLENELIEVDRNRLKSSIAYEWKSQHASDETYVVDEYRLEEETSLQLDESVKKIQDICKDILEAVFASTDECPLELREIMRFTMLECEKSFVGYGEMCVGGLFFLRFMCPAIISPHLFGIVASSPESNAARTLVLICKVLQNIANGGGESEKKESFMRCLSKFTTSMVIQTKSFLRNLAQVNEQDWMIYQQMERKNMEFIDDDLKTKCLHILHQFFRDSHQKKTYRNDGNVDEEVDIVYRNILTELKLERFMPDQLVKSDKPQVKVNGEEQPQRRRERNARAIPSPRGPPTIVRRNGTTQPVPSPSNRKDKELPSEKTARAKVLDSLPGYVQSIVDQFDCGSGGDDSINQEIGLLVRNQLCMSLYGLLRVGLKTSSVWEYITEIAQTNDFIKALTDRIQGDLADVVKVTILVCHALNDGAIHAMVMVFLDEHEFSEKFYSQEGCMYMENKDVVLQQVCRLLDRRFNLRTDNI
jgi:hypothetical protein